VRPLGSGRSAAPPDPAAGVAARAFAVTDATTVGARATDPKEQVVDASDVVQVFPAGLSNAVYEPTAPVAGAQAALTAPPLNATSDPPPARRVRVPDPRSSTTGPPYA
jgi:hypothetical protein